MLTGSRARFPRWTLQESSCERIAWENWARDFPKPGIRRLPPGNDVERLYRIRRAYLERSEGSLFRGPAWNPETAEWGNSPTVNPTIVEAPARPYPSALENSIR